MSIANTDQNDEHSSDGECDNHFDYLIDQTDNNSSNDENMSENDYNLIESVCNALQKKVLDQNNKYRNGIKLEHMVLCDDYLYVHNTDNYSIDVTPDPIIIDNNITDNNNTNVNIDSVVDNVDSNANNDAITDNNILVNDVIFDSIPNSFEDFLLTVYNLNPVLLACNHSKVCFKDRRDYQKQYENYDTYRNVFIPRIFDELWTSMKNSRLSRNDCEPKCARFRSIDSERFKSLKRIDCDLIRDGIDCEFSFGQIIILKYLTDSEQKSVFGVIQSIHSHHSAGSLLSDLPIDAIPQQSDNIVDRISVVCNKVNLNTDRVSILGLNCIQSYLLQARLIYEFQQFSIWNQVLNPIHKFDISGLQINIEREAAIKYFEDQFEAIQKGYDSSVLESAELSKFIAVYGTKKTGKTEVLRETVLQILKYGQLKETEKVIVISNNKDEITATFKHLKKHSVKVLHIDNNGIGCAHKKKDIAKAIKHLGLSTEMAKLISDPEVYRQCIEFYTEYTETPKPLSIKAKLLSEQLLGLALAKLINESEVIIGELDCIFNNLMFNTSFQGTDFNKVKKIALIDDAERYTEPEIFILLFAGIEKIILYGDIIDKNVYLKSFLKRYVTLFNSCKKASVANSHKSVFHLKSTIEDQINTKLKNVNTQKNVQRNNNNNKSQPPNNFNGKGHVSSYKDYKRQNAKYKNNNWNNNRFKKQKTHHFTSHAKVNNKIGDNFIPIQNTEFNQMPLNNSETIEKKPFNVAYGNRYSYSGTNTSDQYSSDTTPSQPSSFYQSF